MKTTRMLVGIGQRIKNSHPGVGLRL